MESQKFFSGLFDFSFKEFVTPKIIRVIYIIVIVFSAVGALAWVVTSFATQSVAGWLLAIILGAISLLFGLILWRMTLEVVSALFRINENVAQAVQLLGGTATAAPHGGDETSLPPPPAAPTTPPPPTEIPPTTPPPPPEAPPPSS